MTQCRTCGNSLDSDGACRRCSAPAQTAKHQGQTQHAGRQPRAGHRYPLPTGIKLLCGLLVLSGLGSLAIGLQLQSIGQTAASYGVSSAGSAMGLAGLLTLVFGGAELVAAFGLWTRRAWGWTAGMGVAGCGLLTSLLLLADPFTSTVGLLGLLYSGGVGWYIYGKRWLFAGEQQQRESSQRAPVDRQQRNRTGENPNE